MITKGALRKNLTPYYFLLPAILVLAVVILYPVFSNLVMSVYKVKLFRGAGDEFIGLTHYAKLFGSRTFVNSIWSSVRFTLYSLPVAFVLGLGMALIFNEIRKYRPVFTGFLLIPWAIAPVVDRLYVALALPRQLWPRQSYAPEPRLHRRQCPLASAARHSYRCSGSGQCLALHALYHHHAASRFAGRILRAVRGRARRWSQLCSSAFPT